MTRQEANERIVFSRHTLGIYKRAIEGGDRPAGAEVMIRNERRVLGEIAACFPDANDRMTALVSQWDGVLTLLERQLN